MVFSDRGFSFLTPVEHPGRGPGSTGQARLAGFSGFLCCFFPFPDEREKDNPPSAEKDSFEGDTGISGFLRWPRIALWPVHGYLSSSLSFEVLHQFCTQRVEVDIADKFQEIRIFFADDRFVSVLEKMATSSMALVEGNGVSGHEAAHDIAE